MTYQEYSRYKLTDKITLINVIKELKEKKLYPIKKNYLNDLTKELDYKLQNFNLFNSNLTYIKDDSKSKELLSETKNIKVYRYFLNKSHLLLSEHVSKKETKYYLSMTTNIFPFKNDKEIEYMFETKPEKLAKIASNINKCILYQYKKETSSKFKYEQNIFLNNITLVDIINRIFKIKKTKPDTDFLVYFPEFNKFTTPKKLCYILSPQKLYDLIIKNDVKQLMTKKTNLDSKFDILNYNIYVDNVLYESLYQIATKKIPKPTSEMVPFFLLNTLKNNCLSYPKSNKNISKNDIKFLEKEFQHDIKELTTELKNYTSPKSKTLSISKANIDKYKITNTQEKEDHYIISPESNIHVDSLKKLISAKNVSLETTNDRYNLDNELNNYFNLSSSMYFQYCPFNSYKAKITSEIDKSLAKLIQSIYTITTIAENDKETIFNNSLNKVISKFLFYQQQRFDIKGTSLNDKKVDTKKFNSSYGISKFIENFKADILNDEIYKPTIAEFAEYAYALQNNKQIPIKVYNWVLNNSDKEEIQDINKHQIESMDLNYQLTFLKYNEWNKLSIIQDMKKDNLFTDNFKINNVYKVNNQKNYNYSGKYQKTLMHGTKNNSVLSILKYGLLDNDKLSEKKVQHSYTGSWLGKGIYFAKPEECSKCTSYVENDSNKKQYIFVATVEYNNKVLRDSYEDRNKKTNNIDLVHGQHLGYYSRDEFVARSYRQVHLEYLIEIDKR